MRWRSCAGGDGVAAVKSFRAYGGSVIIRRDLHGWTYEVYRNQKYRPPRQLFLEQRQGRVPVYCFFSGVHGFGRRQTLKEAKRAAIAGLRQ